MAVATADGSCSAYKSTVGFYAGVFLGLSTTADKAASYLRGRDPLTGALKVFYSWTGTRLVSPPVYDGETVRARFAGWWEKTTNPCEIEVVVTPQGRGWLEWTAYGENGDILGATDAPVELFQCAVTWPSA